RRRTEIAQHRVVAGFVGLVEGEQRFADQNQHAIAVNLRRTWRRLLRVLRLRKSARYMSQRDKGGDDSRHHGRHEHEADKTAYSFLRGRSPARGADLTFATHLAANS